ncbi:transcriptional regulator [Rathayibacter festucae DSM 15932]|uniref:Transcriptional regulator n=1 Tax=Rathayibacter festucae DSM 15932 TaxID=1328866 RepID=A0A3Q9UXZ2_9MICO|nr:transcriptional regulator [Rathayibacter festucae DSM 15932]
MPPLVSGGPRGQSVCEDGAVAAEVRWQELGDFLRARRAELKPGDLGLVDTAGTRRVPGLRREEIARAASISTDYYTRLEQGRLPASAPVLDELSRVLRLSADQRSYLGGLAGKMLLAPAAAGRRPVAAPVQRMLDDLSLTPAFVMGPRTEILAWNVLGAALITDFAAIPEQDRLFIRLLFTDPRMRELYADWFSVVDLAIAQLRMDSARDPDDQQLHAIVDDLTTSDAAFAQLWQTHEVAARSSGAKILRHPLVGELVLDWAALTVGADPSTTIIVWTAEPGSQSQTRLRQLAALADRDQV